MDKIVERKRFLIFKCVLILIKEDEYRQDRKDDDRQDGG